MKIRQARFSDLDQILEIELENFSLEEAIPRSVFEAHLREIQTSFLVAEKEGRILGYIEGPVVPHRHLQDQSFTEEIKDYSHRPGGYISVTALGAAGDNLVLKIGSYIPFISTFFMPFRAINGYASGLEAWISLAITVVFAVTATVFIGRMYASLVLQTDDLGIWKTFKRALAYK